MQSGSHPWKGSPTFTVSRPPIENTVFVIPTVKQPCVQMRTCCSAFKIKTRPRRRCSRQSHRVGAARGLLRSRRPAQFMLRPRDRSAQRRTEGEAVRPAARRSTAPACACSGSLLRGSLTLGCTRVFWLGPLQPQRGKSCTCLRLWALLSCCGHPLVLCASLVTSTASWGEFCSLSDTRHDGKGGGICRQAVLQGT